MNGTNGTHPGSTHDSTAQYIEYGSSSSTDNAIVEGFTQCPYDDATICKETDDCEGCEDYGKHLKDMGIK